MSIAEESTAPGAFTAAKAAAARKIRKKEAPASFPWAVTLLLLTMAVPSSVGFYFGPLLMTPTRLLLLVLFIPCLFMLIGSRGLRSWDYLMIASVSWYFLCAVINRGADKGIQFGGTYILQTLGAFLVASATLRRPEQVQQAVVVCFVIVCLLLPFALHENLTGQRFLNEFFGSFFGGARPIQGDTRFGFFRAATSMSHPIMFGVFCGVLIALVWYSTRSIFWRLVKTGVVSLATTSSLSSGAFLPMMVQFAFIAGERISRGVPNRAWLLFWTLLAVYVFLDTFSDRGPFGLMASYLTFNPHTAWTRIYIWEHGIDDVLRNPIIGMPNDNWTRPHWMRGSVDNHWLVHLMRSGFPGPFFLLLAVFLILREMMRVPDREVTELYAWMRRGALYAMIAFILAGGTVHFFDRIEPLFGLYIGIAAALARMDCRVETPREDDTPKRRPRRGPGGARGDPEEPPPAAASPPRNAGRRRPRGEMAGKAAPSAPAEPPPEPTRPRAEPARRPRVNLARDGLPPPRRGG